MFQTSQWRDIMMTLKTDFEYSTSITRYAVGVPWNVSWYIAFQSLNAISSCLSAPNYQRTARPASISLELA